MHDMASTPMPPALCAGARTLQVTGRPEVHAYLPSPLCSVLFDSDKSDLRAAGRATLDDFVASIRGLDSQSIMAIGYADRMGSEGANQILSEERVGVVKAYLVGKGIAAERVRTSAFGETRPDTARADCKDANNAANVACMQPDRHVFIEVSGTRIAK